MAEGADAGAAAPRRPGSPRGVEGEDTAGRCDQELPRGPGDGAGAGGQHRDGAVPPEQADLARGQRGAAVRHRHHRLEPGQGLLADPSVGGQLPQLEDSVLRVQAERLGASVQLAVAGRLHGRAPGGLRGRRCRHALTGDEPALVGEERRRASLRGEHDGGMPDRAQRLRVPQPDGAVVAGEGRQAAVGAELQELQLDPSALEFHVAAAGHVPDAGDPVAAGGGQAGAVGMEGDVLDGGAMATEDAGHGGGEVPDTDRTIQPSQRQRVSGRAEGNDEASGPARVPEDPLRPPRRDVPDPDCLVHGAGHEPATLGIEADAGHLELVAPQNLGQRTG